MRSIFAKQPPHRQNALTRNWFSQQVEQNAQDAKWTFIVEQPLGFEQMHRSLSFPIHMEARRLQDPLPLGGSQARFVCSNGN